MRVAPDKSSKLRVDNGPSITVPVGSVDRQGTLKATQTQPPTPVPTGMTGLGPTYSLEVSGASVTGPVDLTFPVPLSDDGPKPALLAYYDDGQKGMADRTRSEVRSCYAHADRHSYTDP